jgi:hypothetical protein
MRPQVDDDSGPPLLFEHLHCLEPKNAHQSSRQAERQVIGMKSREVEQITQERDVKHQTKEEGRSTDDPPEGGVRGPQRGPDRAGP